MSTMTGAKALIEILRQEGVEYIFGIPGATETYFMEALEDEPSIKYILSLNEIVSTGMAEGYARTSGKPGVLNLHTSPGLAAAMPMLCNAFHGGVPLIVTAGQQDTRLMASEPSLYDDMIKMSAPFVKWGTEVNHVEDLAMVMRRAFKTATQNPTGPVFVSLPHNVLGENLDFEYYRTSPNNKVYPDIDVIKKAADLLVGAEIPVIIVGDGIGKSGALKEVTVFAEEIGAKVYQGWMSEVNFPCNHPQYMYDLDVNNLATRDLLEKFDMLVVVGAPFFSMSEYVPKSLLTPRTKIIQIDSNPWQISKNFPINCAVEGDIRESLIKLVAVLKNQLTDEARGIIKNRIAAITQEKQKSNQSFLEKVAKEKENFPISCTRLMQEIKDALKPGTRIVEDSWSYSAILRRYFDFSEPLSYQRLRGGGSIGWGLPGALGVKLASPDRPVVCISGDGSALWGIQSLWTASHYNLPVTYIILSNSCYRNVRLIRKKILGPRGEGKLLGTDLSNPKNDFCKLAEGMGLAAQRVDKPEDLKSVLKTAVNMDKANLVEVQIDSSL